MKLKKLTAVIMAALLVASMTTACGSAKKGTISSSVTLLETADMFTDRDKEIGYDEADCVSITLSGDSASCSDNGVSIAGSTVTITKEGTYLLSGTLTDGSIIVDADSSDKIRLILNGVNISSSSSAAIYVKQADKVFITLDKGTENTLANAGEYASTDENGVDAVVFSKDDLTFNGLGTLTIKAKYGHGIVSKDDLVITGGTYQITAEKKGLDANDSIRIADGSVTINSGTDGLHAENADDSSLGYIYIADGELNITSGTDAMDASGVLQIDNGAFILTTGGGSTNASTKQDGGFNSDWGNWGGGRMGGRTDDGSGTHTRGGMGQKRHASSDDTTDAAITTLAASAPAASAATASSDSSSAKGLKADQSIVINNGTFTIDSSDDAIHSNNALTVTGGTLTIQSGDDGMHADAALTINGGTVNITKSYEGIEGQTIDIGGGSIEVTASDDGLNAAGGNDQSSMNGRPGQNEFASQDGVSIHISGGTVNVNSSGDGIDSNGDLTISGGEVYVSGSADNGNAALDYNGNATVTGGIVIAAGMSGMAQNFGSSSTQGSMLVNVSNQSADSTITLKDSSGKTIASYTPAKAYNSVVVSAPAIKKGSSYTLQTGSTETSVTMDALIYGGGNGMGGQGRMGGQGGRSGENTMQDGNAPQMGGNIPQQGGNIPQQGGNIPQQGGNIPQSSNLPENGGKRF